jgi:hypothetical protein
MTVYWETCTYELTKYDVVIGVLTSESACFVIIRIAVSPRTVGLEVVTRRRSTAHIWIVEGAATAVLVRIVGDAGALARHHVATFPYFQVIWTSRVEVAVTASRCA